MRFGFKPRDPPLVRLLHSTFVLWFFGLQVPSGRRDLQGGCCCAERGGQVPQVGWQFVFDG